jgi:hypothetical protein
VKPLPKEARTPNLPGKEGKQERCHYCLDTGYVVAVLRPAGAAMVHRQRVPPPADSFYEEMGPCPMCQLGYATEFAEGVSAWREEGYWQGREAADIHPLEESDSKPDTSEENARRAREYIAEITARMAEKAM